jgi:molecular chaperone GrpE (heat shock protein)
METRLEPFDGPTAPELEMEVPPSWEMPAGAGEEETVAPSAESAAPVTAEPVPVNALERLESAIHAGFAEILGEFRDKLALDRFKEEQITKLHEEVQAFRNDLVLRTVRQVLQGLIRLHDDLGKVTASMRLRPAEEQTPERFFQQLSGFQDDVELLLGQHGVEKFEAAGDEFDPRRQTALRTVPAGDSGQVCSIAERLRPGFEQGEALLQKERVAVFAATSGTNDKAKEEIVP